MQGNGVTTSGLTIDWPDLMRFRRTFTDPVPEQNERGFASAGIGSLHGRARFVDRTTLRVENQTITRSEQPPTVFTRPTLVAEPALPSSNPPRPHGTLDHASAEEIRRVAAITWSDLRSDTGSRDRGLRRVLAHLASFPGETWQQRWAASGRDVRGRPVRDLARRSNSQAEASQGLEALCCLRVLQPSLEAFRSNRFNDYAETFRVAQADASLDAFFAAVTATGAARHWQRRAVFDVCCALTTQGIGVVDLTPAAFLHYARTARLGGKIFTQRAVRMLSSLFGAARARGMPPLPFARLMVASGLKEAAAAVQSIDPKLATRLLDGPFESTDFANRFLLSAWGTLTARLWPLLTENLVKTFNGHDFSGKQLLLSPKPVGIYLRWPERDLLALSSLVRLIWDSLIGELITAYDSCQGLGYQPILLLVDEAGRAPIPTLADHATTVVGWGISLWLAVQSLSQLEAIYGKARAQVIRDNMDSQVYYRPTDLSTAEYLEKRLGNVSGYAQSATSAPGAAWTVCRRYAVRGLRRAAEFLWVPGLPAG